MSGDGATGATIEPVVVALPDGRSLVVRRLTVADGPAVRALYEGLDTDDRLRRFFSVFPPGPGFVQRWLGAAGGLVLGAFVRAAAAEPTGAGAPPTAGAGAAGAAGPEGKLVAEAGYALLGNGNGELGITTAADWRGWLGPFLLDLLAEAAHDAGVENIEADVRVDNDPMLGLIAHRGMAVTELPSDGHLRVVMSTGAAVPSWPAARGPVQARVLVESPGGHWVRDVPRGIDVMGCPGPHRRPGGRCPLLQGERCPLVDGADVVVTVTGTGGADPAEPALVAVAEAHRRRTDGPPSHVCGSAAALQELLARLAGSGPGPVPAPDGTQAGGRPPGEPSPPS